MCGCHVPPAGDLARNPGMFPDWELNRQPFGSQSGTQSTELHQPGLLMIFVLINTLSYHLHAIECAFKYAFSVVIIGLQYMLCLQKYISESKALY